MGFFMFSIFGSYAYAMTIGSLWVDNEFPNQSMGRPYSPGDIMAVFFGVLFGMFAIAGIGENVKIVAEGRAAGKMAFDVIDREPVFNSCD